MTDADAATAILFGGKDEVVSRIYDRLIEVLRPLGPWRAEPKKTSLHLVHTVGFAGVHPRKTSLMLTIRSEQPIASPRVAKAEQVSRNRYHNDIKLSAPDDVDEELVGWLSAAYALG